MSDDFFYALMIGWSVLLLFWIVTILFIYLRKPPNSKLTNKILLISSALFIGTLLVLIYFK
jgi:hypothetical protein